MNWVQRRNRFQHDWLKNRYLLQLGRYLNLLDALIEDPDLEEEFFRTMLPEWGTHREEALQLVNSFEFHMGPRVLFDEYPLTSLRTETRFWLGETVQSLWRARYPISEWVEDSLSSIEAVDRAYVTLQGTDSRLKDAACNVKPRRAAVEELIESCRDLSRAIAQFPILVRLI